MRVLYFELKQNIPLYHHQLFVELIEKLGTPMGYHHFKRRSAQRMGDHISDQIYAELLNFLKSDDSQIAITVDGARDKSQDHFLCIFIQTLRLNRPRVFFYRVPLLGSNESADGLLLRMKDVFQKDGITEVIKQRLTSFVANGAAVNLGKKGGLAVKLENFVGRKLFKVHCLAHRLNLAVRKVFNDNEDLNWIFPMESAIKQVHTFFYNKGHKRKSTYLKRVHERDMGSFWWRLPNSLVTSRKKAIFNILKHHKPLIGALTLMGKEKCPYKVDKNTRSIANGMIQHLSDKNLLIIMHYLLDILDVIEAASLNFQKRYGLLMDQTKNLAELTTALAKIGANSGEYYTEQFLKTCECDGKNVPPCKIMKELPKLLSKEMRSKVILGRFLIFLLFPK